MKKSKKILKECDNVVNDLYALAYKYAERAKATGDQGQADYCEGIVYGLNTAIYYIRFYVLGGGCHHES